MDPYLNKHYAKKLQVDKNWCKYMLFRIDAYFNKFLLAAEIDEKGHITDILFLRRKDMKHQKKNLLNFKLNLLKLIQVIQKVVMIYDLDYEVGNIEAFTDEFKKLIKNNNKKKLNNQPNY